MRGPSCRVRRVVVGTAVVVACAGAWWATVELRAQQVPSEQAAQEHIEPAPAPEPSLSSDVVQDPPTTRRNTPYRAKVIRIGQNYTVAADDHVGEVVVILGTAVIEGRVDRDVVVVLGTLRLGPTADIGHGVVAAGSSAVVESGARVGREFVVAGGHLDAPADFRPARESVVIGLPGINGQLEAVATWLTHGLLWGRLVVPGLGWMWVAIAAVVAVYLLCNLLFANAVVACRQAIAERPLSAALVGLLVLVLLGPASFVLSVSVIGIPVIPFLLCGVVIAAVLGKIGLTRWIGSSLVPESEEGGRLESIRSFAIGTAVILAAYMVPLLGIVVWAVGGVVGLGAATLALSSGWRRENRRHVSFRMSDAPSAVSTPLVYPERPYEPAGVPVPYPPVEPFPSEGASASAAPVPDMPGASTSSSHPSIVSMPKAPFLDRLAAFALDVLLVSLAYAFFGPYGGARIFFLWLLVYHIVAWALKGTTVGGMICNLRVVRVDGGPLSFGDTLIRGLSSIFSIAALGIGCLWILRDPDNQAWHDRFAGTYVVKVPRNWPL